MTKWLARKYKHVFRQKTQTYDFLVVGKFIYSSICLRQEFTEEAETEEKQLTMRMRLNTVEVGCSVCACIFTGCVDVDVGFASTVFTGSLSVTDAALEHIHTSMTLTTDKWTFKILTHMDLKLNQHFSET